MDYASTEEIAWKISKAIVEGMRIVEYFGNKAIEKRHGYQLRIVPLLKEQFELRHTAISIFRLYAPTKNGVL